MAYFDEWVFSHTKSNCDKALYVGVGHGHDALYALLMGYVNNIVGVDPYYESDGNDEQDYYELISLIARYDLHNRFKVYRSTIKSYLEDSNDMVDHVFFIDLLHHIFVTKHRLRESESFIQAVDLF